ncbi:MAG TPA: hypothetical protein VF733_04695 [Candidatus Saccharimonadales bacterium]
MKTGEALPDSFEKEIIATHQAVEMLHLFKEVSAAHSSVDHAEPLARKTIEGVDYDVLDEGHYDDLAMIDGDELAYAIPEAAAHFGISLGSGHIVEIGFSPAFVDQKDAYHPPKSFITISHKLPQGRDEADLFELTDGGLVSERTPRVRHTFNPDTEGNTMSEEELKGFEATNERIAVLHFLGKDLQVPDELRAALEGLDAQDDEGVPETESEKGLVITDAEEAEAALNQIGKRRKVVPADLRALKEIVDFAHKNLKNE